jgi:excisionase family DNA binding protein
MDDRLSSHTPTATASGDLLTCQQAAELLQVRENTLARWRLTNRYPLPYLRVGRMIRYRAEDVTAFLDSCREVCSTGDEE